jgi:hypothetical protein
MHPSRCGRRATDGLHHAAPEPGLSKVTLIRRFLRLQYLCTWNVYMGMELPNAPRESNSMTRARSWRLVNSPRLALRAAYEEQRFEGVRHSVTTDGANGSNGEP